MRYRYLVDFRRGISVFAIFSYGIAVLGTPQCPPRHSLLKTGRGFHTRSILMYTASIIIIYVSHFFFSHQEGHVTHSCKGSVFHTIQTDTFPYSI